MKKRSKTIFCRRSLVEISTTSSRSSPGRPIVWRCSSVYWGYIWISLKNLHNGSEILTQKSLTLMEKPWFLICSVVMWRLMKETKISSLRKKTGFFSTFSFFILLFLTQQQSIVLLHCELYAICVFADILWIFYAFRAIFHESTTIWSQQEYWACHGRFLPK